MRDTDRQAGRQTETKTDRQAERQRQIDRQRDRDREVKTVIETKTERDSKQTCMMSSKINNNNLPAMLVRVKQVGRGTSTFTMTRKQTDPLL